MIARDRVMQGHNNPGLNWTVLEDRIELAAFATFCQFICSLLFIFPRASLKVEALHFLPTFMGTSVTACLCLDASLCSAPGRGHTDEMDQSHFVFSISNSARSSVQWSDGLESSYCFRISGLNEQPEKKKPVNTVTVAIEFVGVQIKNDMCMHQKNRARQYQM
jgi:hypothetical protein